MNTFKNFRLSAAALFLLFILPVSSQAAHIAFFVGDVSVLRQGKKVPVSMGTAMEAGDLIKTGARSTMELTYDDGSRITISENSSAKVGSSSVKGSDSVTLLSGNLGGKFSKMKKEDRRVYTPTTICAIRGTEFTVSVSRGGDSRVDLSEGRLAISNPYGGTDLNQGEKIEAQVSEAPEKSETAASVEEWQANKQSELLADPGKKSDQYREHIGRLKNKSDRGSESVNSVSGMVSKADNKKKLEETGMKLEAADREIKDDLFLNEASGASIENIMQDFQARDKKIYDEFTRLKAECNLVLEQQRRNYEALQAVKKSHQEARDRIMGAFQKDRDSIRDTLKMNEVKPKIK